MHEQLWIGTELKLQYAKFHFQHMELSLKSHTEDPYYVQQEIMRRVVDTGWQRSLWPHFDAFLSTARSIPEIIRCCFGEDPHMSTWLKTLDSSEQTRRKNFSKQFATDYQSFCKLPLSKARNISVHRKGFAPVEVTISGQFGVTYVGDPTTPLPPSETRPINDPDLAWLPKPVPVLPKWDDFTIEGQPLFPTCLDYLQSADTLIQQARSISSKIHGTKNLTSPPS